MKKSIILFVMTAALSVGMIVYGCIFTGSQISEATLTEETITGDRKAADGLTVGFRADSADDLHWINSFDYSSGKTESVFKRGEMLEVVEPSIYDDIRRDDTFVGTMLKTVKTSMYDDIRFTGWSTAPFTTKLDYDGLEGLQEKEIHAFYDDIQQSVMKSGAEKEGKIRLKDYLDYYPVSFRFQLGTNKYDSSNALTGLKIYDEQRILSPESGAAYDEDVDLYAALNDRFRIPVIDNEYQEYKVSGEEAYDPETSLGYTTEVKKSSGTGEDYYEFDPIMALEEDNEKNRMLFIVNNRTAKGAPVDVSQISGGYGIYELPIEVSTTTIKIGHRTVAAPDPTPLADRMAMVYPLDEESEYVEMSLSGDHRYLAVFSVKDGRYFVELADADTWTSNGPVDLFPASEKMTYAWGEDGSLAVTNHEDHIAVLCRTGSGDRPYEVLYSGKVQDDFDDAFFDTEMVIKKNSYAGYQYGIDEGLAVAVKDGKAALVQNPLVGDPGAGIRNAALACVVIDKSGVIYSGILKSDIVDLGYDMSGDEIQTTGDLLDGAGNGAAESKAGKYIIQPVRSENRVQWETPEE